MWQGVFVAALWRCQLEKYSSHSFRVPLSFKNVSLSFSVCDASVAMTLTPSNLSCGHWLWYCSAVLICRILGEACQCCLVIVIAVHHTALGVWKRLLTRRALWNLLFVVLKNIHHPFNEGLFLFLMCQVLSYCKPVQAG